MTTHAKWKAWPNQARRHPSTYVCRRASTDVNGRRRAWCEWALTNGNCVACSRGSTYYVDYLQTYCTDFRNLFTIWKHFTCRWWNVTLFSDFSRDVAMATKSFVNVRYNTAKIAGVFCQIFPESFQHMKALYVQMMALYFFSKFGQLPSSNLGVYAVKTCNFCRHAPAFLGRSSYVTLAFRNGLEDCNFDFSRVIDKHFCTPCRNLVRFGSVTPEFKT